MHSRITEGMAAEDLQLDEEEEPPGSGGVQCLSRLHQLQRSASPQVQAFRAKYFPLASDDEWGDWRWQAAHRYRRLEELEPVIELSVSERAGIERGGSMLPVGITPYYMALVSSDDPNQALRRTVIPSLNEFVRTPGEADDPLG